MTKILVTYHMTKGPHDSAETCITLPMDERHALNLMVRQEKSGLVFGPGRQRGHLSIILNHLARLQGYSFAEFVCAEIAREGNT